MYAYANVIIERPDVRSLPLKALSYQADRTYCWLYNDGHAKRTEIRTGTADARMDRSDEVVSHQVADGDEPIWTPFDGSERVILGDLSILTDGAAGKRRRQIERGKGRECGTESGR